MAKTLTNRELKQAAAETQIDAERALATLTKISEDAPTTELIRDIELLRSRMSAILDLWRPLAIGLRTSQAAERLDVSEPTVRKWINEGFLTAIPERAPLEITPASVARVGDALAFVREHFPARTWTDQLAALLHDRDLQDQDWFQTGAQEYRRGELVDL